MRMRTKMERRDSCKQDLRGIVEHEQRPVSSNVLFLTARVLVEEFPVYVPRHMVNPY